MTQDISYHLWLKPSGATYDALATVIEALSRELGGPAFAPHVTLLGSLTGTEQQHRDRTEVLASQLKPFEIAFAGPGTGPEYFECVFMRVQPTAAVMNAHALAQRAFGRTEEAYRPHLSIVYGDFPDRQKQEVIPSLSAFAHQSFMADRVYLIKAFSHDPKDWQEIASAAMSKAA